jgi:YaeQ protein
MADDARQIRRLVFEHFKRHVTPAQAEAQSIPRFLLCEGQELRFSNAKYDNERPDPASGGNAAEMWWKQNAPLVERLSNLSIINLPQESTKALAKLAERNMQFSASIQDGAMTFSSDAEMVLVEMVVLKTVG